jgi:hypothetical protein
MEFIINEDLIGKKVQEIVKEIYYLSYFHFNKFFYVRLRFNERIMEDKILSLLYVKFFNKNKVESLYH